MREMADDAAHKTVVCPVRFQSQAMRSSVRDGSDAETYQRLLGRTFASRDNTLTFYTTGCVVLIACNSWPWSVALAVGRGWT